MAASQLPVQFPLSFTLSANGPSAYNDVYGITWDNGVHGWVFGQNFILARAAAAVTACGGASADARVRARRR